MQTLRSLIPTPLGAFLRPLPQTVPICLRNPQSEVDVFLDLDGRRIDVTERAVVVSLSPFKVGIGLSAEADPGGAGGRTWLHFVDCRSRCEVAALELSSDSVLAFNPNLRFVIFDVRDGRHQCFGWPRRVWNTRLQDRAFRRKSRDTLNMTAAGVQHTMLFYVCPRPVVLVTVADETHSNLFPMDLIGPVSDDCFTLALRSTSPSIQTMKASRRVAISDMPAPFKQTIYALGAHHQKPNIDWGHLPFGVRRTPSFALSVPEDALRVRELEIFEHHSIGSHTLFATRIATDERYRDGGQLFHASGNYQYFRERHGYPFELVP